MPKRSEIIRKITKAAKAQGMNFAEKREGGNHTIFDLNGVMIPVRRHRDFTNYQAEEIYRECETQLGKGWWR